ncbi:MAG: NRDE family protein, partial [Betaproteobacteria bacterium]|nr:NRDE family protein [Betaproteobacteria bacterium]
MCLVAIAWQAHPDFPLVVAANRDEWRDRPALPAHWW